MSIPPTQSMLVTVPYRLFHSVFVLNAELYWGHILQTKYWSPRHRPDFSQLSPTNYGRADNTCFQNSGWWRFADSPIYNLDRNFSSKALHMPLHRTIAFTTSFLEVIQANERIKSKNRAIERLQNNKRPNPTLIIHSTSDVSAMHNKQTKSLKTQLRLQSVV